jgi:hypothetical protein
VNFVTRARATFSSRKVFLPLRAAREKYFCKKIAERG